MKSGYTNIWEPESRVEHYKQKGVIEENFSKAKIAKTAQRNQLLFIWKNITDPGYLLSHKFNLLKNCLLHPKYTMVVLSALILLPQVLQKRLGATKGFKVSDKDIFNKYQRDSL